MRPIAIRGPGAALAALALAGCAQGGDGFSARDLNDRLTGGDVIVEGATRPTPANPRGDVFVTDDGNVYECNPGVLFRC